MVSRQNLGALVKRWADDEASVGALVLIGSQVHGGKPGVGSPDEHSDWDFQIVTSDPAMFHDSRWLQRLGTGRPCAYVDRPGRLGTARKITALLDGVELDLVIIPAEQIRFIAQQVESGGYATNAAVLLALADQAAVLHGGYQIIKGQAEYGKLFAFVAAEINPRRLNDESVRSLAEGFVCDYVATCRKLERGELLAAQRWVHLHLAETNFQLLHELRRRSAQPTFPDARRIELLVEDGWRRAVEVQASPNPASLRAAMEKSRETCCQLLRALVGDTWHWPALSP